MSVENNVIIFWIHFINPVLFLAHIMRSLLKSNQISRSKTAIRYQMYTNPNMAIAELRFGVRNISNALSGCPRWASRGKGATIKKARDISRDSR